MPEDRPCERVAAMLVSEAWNSTSEINVRVRSCVGCIQLAGRQEKCGGLVNGVMGPQVP